MNRRAAFRLGTGLAILIGASAGPLAHGAEPSSAVISQYDKDADRTLDWGEVEQAARARFDKLNEDADDTLDHKETKDVIGKESFKAADPDNDGTLSKTEYLALVKKVFEQADTDKDGRLDAKELSTDSGRRLKRLID